MLLVEQNVRQVLEIARYQLYQGDHRDSFEDPPSLTHAIREVERTIVAWLKKLGYTPKFG